MPDSSLIGKAKELQVAALLTELGFQVFLPLVDKGFDLVFTNAPGAHFVPVQVKYRAIDSSLTLERKDIKKFKVE